MDKAGLIAALATAGTAMVLPKNLRKTGLGALAGFEAGMARRNSSLNPKAKPNDFGGAVSEGPLMMAALGGLLGHLMDGKEDDLKLGMTLDKGTKKELVMYLTGEKKF